MTGRADADDLPKARRTIYSLYIKRLLDILLSGAALVVLSPVFIIVSVLELVFHGRPIFYCTDRPGKDGKIFRLYKFRSMTNERGADGYLLPESRRITRFGRFIRKTSIDELPELFNIFKGDMSIVGPRPLLVEYMQYYSPRHAMRMAVRPGLALGMLSKPDGCDCTWREQFENDIWYIENISLITDIRMIFAILRMVFQASDVRADDTRVPFDGKNLDETRSREEAGKNIHFDSLEKQG